MSGTHSHVRLCAQLIKTRVFFLLGMLPALFGAPANAQQTLADGDWFKRELGQGVVWRHYLFDNLYGSKQSVSYIEADLSSPSVTVEFPYLASARQRSSAMIPGQYASAVGGINGTYFATSGAGGHVTYLRINNAEVPRGGPIWSPWGYEGGIALNLLGEASMQRIPNGGWVNNTTHPDILACGPLVVINGTIPSQALTDIGAHCTARHPRSAVGLTADNRLILFTVDGRTDMSAGMTCQELGQAMEELGCVHAMNLDGGGSTTLWGAGEPFSGVLNYPSDNGVYDHGGERSCSNAIAVLSSAPTPAVWDGRLITKSFSPTMVNGGTQTVTLQYKNIGTATWTASDTRLVLARPQGRTSAFHKVGDWVSPEQPALMSPSNVGPGETATFTFVLQAPTLTGNAVYNEHFMLTQSGVGRIGPADSEAWMRISIQLPVTARTDFLVESRPGGQNVAWYSDSGMADVAVDCKATSCTPGIGMRYGSTYRSVAGYKKAVVAPDFPEGAFYNVYVAWGGGSSRRSPVTYHVTRPGTTYTLQLDQAATSNTWIRLGTEPFYFEKGFSGQVLMTNEDIDVSGNMFAGAVKFEYVAPQPSEKSYRVEWLGEGASKPVIDGQVASGEWGAASPAGTGFVRHDSPGTPAVEDAGFQMLFDDLYLYLLLQMTNSYLPGWAVPSASYGYSDLGGDKMNFFLTPFGPNSQRFYRLVFSPNPANLVCYVWSQASAIKTTSATVGTDWSQRGGAAFSYSSNLLTVEYRIPWSAFNYGNLEIGAAPGNGDTWGVQPCLTNQLTASSSESVNWEPDTTGSFIFGEPFGELVFAKSFSSVKDWTLY